MADRGNSLVSLFLSGDIVARTNRAALLTIIVHPFKLVTKLIQLGYEPLPPSRVHFLFYDAMILPNKFTYLKFIYNKDGFFGCFRGLGGELVGKIVSSTTYLTYFKDNIEDIIDDYEAGLTFRLLKWDIVATTLSVVVSHPFYVASTRQIAQFVGRETKYNGLWSALYIIAKEEGMPAWFSGLTPRLIDEVLSILLSFGTLYFLTILFSELQNHKLLTLYITTSIVSSIMYPYKVIGACMQINNSGLQVGSLPMMPDYMGNWVLCYEHLFVNNQLYRGESFFLRRYIPISSF